MIRTFDFVFILRRSEEERRKIVSMMEQTENAECEIKGWHLLFQQERKVVIVTNNGTDDYLAWKFIPAQISYDSLRTLMGMEAGNQNAELDIRYLSSCEQTLPAKQALP